MKWEAIRSPEHLIIVTNAHSVFRFGFSYVFLNLIVSCPRQTAQQWLSTPHPVPSGTHSVISYSYVSDVHIHLLHRIPTLLFLLMLLLGFFFFQLLGSQNFSSYIVCRQLLSYNPIPIFVSFFPLNPRLAK